MLFAQCVIISLCISGFLTLFAFFFFLNFFQLSIQFTLFSMSTFKKLDIVSIIDLWSIDYYFRLADIKKYMKLAIFQRETNEMQKKKEKLSVNRTFYKFYYVFILHSFNSFFFLYYSIFFQILFSTSPIIIH